MRTDTEKVSLYRDFHNWPLLEVVERVLPAGGAVLDVGCASGGRLDRLQGQAGRRVRFFTLDTLRELVESAGLGVESIDTTQALTHQIPPLAHTPKVLRQWLEESLQGLARRRPQLFAFLLICVARNSI